MESAAIPNNLNIAAILRCLRMMSRQFESSLTLWHQFNPNNLKVAIRCGRVVKVSDWGSNSFSVLFSTVSSSFSFCLLSLSLRFIDGGLIGASFLLSRC